MKPSQDKIAYAKKYAETIFLDIDDELWEWIFELAAMDEHGIKNILHQLKSFENHCKQGEK